MPSFQESCALYGEVAPVDVVTEEQVVCVWEEAPYPEQLHEVMKLTMDVT